MAEIKIKSLLRSKGMTQKQLAQRLYPLQKPEQAASTLSQALARENLSLDLLRRIAEALDCMPGDLLERTPLLSAEDRAILQRAIEILQRIVNTDV